MQHLYTALDRDASILVDKFGQRGVTFDDVLLVPAYSDVLPSKVSTTTSLTRSIKLNIPIMSAAMDSVTEARMAIAIAREGGIGVIHRNLPIDVQASEVDKVKRSESGVITNPITLPPTARLSEAAEIMQRYHISGVPITDSDGKLVGILTNRDIRFEEDYSKLVGHLMTTDDLVTAPVGTSLDDAKTILHQHRIEKLPLVDQNFHLQGLITIKDIEKPLMYPFATKDEKGRLRVAAALGPGDDLWERAHAIVDAEVDVLVIDTAHGHSRRVIAALEGLKERFGDSVPVIVGNVATREGTIALAEAGADAIKVGLGPASICTSRVVAGVGVPQLSAISNCREVAQSYGIPIIGDGGIRYSGDIVKAIAAGADTIMTGSLFAGADESPGAIELQQGRRYKVYRGMGSLNAMALGSRDRYDPTEGKKLVPEGIEARVPHAGPVSEIVAQLIGGLQAGMGYCGTKNIAELQTQGEFIQVTQSGVRESHPHDIHDAVDAPNYRFQ